MKHPMQPIEIDEHGVARFKANAIVRHLIDHGSIDLNDIARLGFSPDDNAQLAQLIGYSVSGFGDLQTASPQVIDAADAEVNRLIADRAGEPPSIDGRHVPLPSALIERAITQLRRGDEVSRSALADELERVALDVQWQWWAWRTP